MREPRLGAAGGNSVSSLILGGLMRVVCGEGEREAVCLERGVRYSKMSVICTEDRALSSNILGP